VYLEKSHVLKREYPEKARPFDWMQDGVFDLLDERGQLYRWETDADLVAATGELP